MNFGKAIRIGRATRDVSQRELATRAELDASYVSLVESGKRNPSLKAVEAIAKALDMPFYLLALLASEEGDLHMLQTQEGPIYTIDLLRQLKKEDGRADAEFRFIVGPDIKEELDRWRSVDEIRNEFGFFEVPDMGLHVSQVRRMLANGVGTWHHHLPQSVARYIRLHGLYHVERVTCAHEFPLCEGTASAVCSKCGLERVDHFNTKAT